MTAPIRAAKSVPARKVPVIKSPPPKAPAAVKKAAAPVVKSIAAPRPAAPAPKAAPVRTPSAVVNISKPSAPSVYNAVGTLAKTAAPVAVPKIQPITPTAPGDGGFVAGTDEVVVDIKASDSGYENQIFWSSDNFVTRHALGIDNHTATVSLGNFAPGTKIDFGIVNGAGQFFRTGGAALNADRFAHTTATDISGGKRIGFEDLYGGGDKDFNDAIIEVRSRARTPAAAAAAAATATATATAVPVPVPVAAAAAAPNIVSPKPLAVPPLPAAPVLSRPTVDNSSTNTTNNNRSGLGDGSNPGQGAGKVNSPNTGTNNPSNTSTSAANLYSLIASLNKPDPVKEVNLKDQPTTLSLAKRSP